MKVSKLAERFFLHSSRTNTPKSLQGIRGRLRLFLNEFGETKTTKVSREKLIAFLQSSQGNLSNQTHRANIIKVEQFQSWAVRFDYLSRPWIRKGDVQKPPAVGRSTLPTPAQTTQILSIMRKDALPIYGCLRQTGARPGELCAARIEQLEGIPGEMVIVQDEHKTARKTGMKRRILLTPDAEKIVLEAIGDRKEGPIFLTASGRQWLRDRLSREYRRCRDHFCISRKVVLYCSRHQLASLMIDSGADISVVAVQLGHKNISTTQKYIHPDERKVRRSVMKIADVA